MTPVLMAAEMQWPAAFALSVFFVSVAVVLVVLIRHGGSLVDIQFSEKSKPPEWRSETTVTRGANPSPPPRTKVDPPPDPKEGDRG